MQFTAQHVVTGVRSRVRRNPVESVRRVTARTTEDRRASCPVRTTPPRAGRRSDVVQPTIDGDQTENDRIAEWLAAARQSGARRAVGSPRSAPGQAAVELPRPTGRTGDNARIDDRPGGRRRARDPQDAAALARRRASRARGSSTPRFRHASASATTSRRCYSTRRSPLGAMDRSARGRSTTNSVRWAGNTCSLTSTGSPVDVRGDPLARSTGEPAGTSSSSASAFVGARGADGLGRAAELDVEQLVERRPLDVGQRQLARRALGAPHGDAGERLAVGQVEPPHLEHASRRRAPAAPAGGAATKPKSRTCGARTRCPASASWASMVPSRPSDWRSGSAATNQPKPWRASTQPSSRSTSSALRTVTRLAS